jgi:hypothetical protein
MELTFHDFIFDKIHKDPILHGGDTKNKDIQKKLLENKTFPSPDDEHFQYKIYKKRNFIINAIPIRDPIPDNQRISKFREICSGNTKLSPTQTLLSNFINPNTPYKGLLIFHGTGAGKTCASIAIAEKFKDMVDKYGTKIHVLVPGPLHKENYISEILKCAGKNYRLDTSDNNMNKSELEKAAINSIKKYYRIMSYRTFYKRVLGEKIKDTVVENDVIKIKSRKKEDGDFERDISLDQIYSLDNTILIIDEAHNITGNQYGDAVEKIINSSKNLKIVLLTATPMKNYADDIIELINYMRPPNNKMKRNKIFASDKGYDMAFRNDGEKYFRKMIRGYVSYLRGADPLTFAKRNDMGIIPPGLDFTKVTRCPMKPFQLRTYYTVIDETNNSFDRETSAVANFCFPGLSKKTMNDELIGYSGIKGISIVKNQLKINAKKITTMIAENILKGEDVPDPSTLLYLEDGGKQLAGDIFNIKYLEHFSSKFYKSIININQLVYGEKGPGLAFVYSNVVQSGVEIYKQVLIANGYLEYNEKSSYNIRDETRCYCCNHSQIDHRKPINNIPQHVFKPATFMVVTGKTDDSDQIDDSNRALFEIFNNPANKFGENIKIVLGSPVMKEGLTLHNIKEIHILDVYFTLGRTDQVLGRGIRFCKHADLMSPSNLFPEVDIYKYVVALSDDITGSKLSSEEILYKNAEAKFKLIKKTERIMQEEAIDCPLNRGGNMFPEELEKYANCGTVDNPCPAICDYMSCEYKCGDTLLNTKYYDTAKGIYRKLSKEELDYSTYDNTLARDEIDDAKTYIKQMYGQNYAYTLLDIINYVKDNYPADKLDLFDEYYVYQALDELIPITENDFNNFTDIVKDIYNRKGYILYVDGYYLFQPFSEPESLPVYYRRNYQPTICGNLPLNEFMKTLKGYENVKDLAPTKRGTKKVAKQYDFDSTTDYYDNREEYDFVGIIDSRNLSGANSNEVADDFKIRPRRPKNLIKKRETGVPSLLGAVCSTSKSRDELAEIMKSINLDSERSYNNHRSSVCDEINLRLFHLEKYSTTAKKNKFTYLMVPANHLTIPFPLNLEDRLKIAVDDIKKHTNQAAKIKVETQPLSKTPDNLYKDIAYVAYHILVDQDITKEPYLASKYQIATAGKNSWKIVIS